MKQAPFKQHNRGFSMVEFIVILTLFAIMASVLSFDFTRFRNRIEQGNLSSDIALSFRQMQVYGISSSNRLIGGQGFDNNSVLVQSLVNSDLALDTSQYGIELDIDEQKMTLFQEQNANIQYDESVDTLVDIISVSGINKLIKVCAMEGSIEPRINRATGECNFSALSPGRELNSGTFTTLFTRPFPDALMDGSSLPSEFETQLALVIIGDPNKTPSSWNYLHISSVGLIKISSPEIS